MGADPRGQRSYCNARRAFGTRRSDAERMRVIVAFVRCPEQNVQLVIFVFS